MNWLKQSSRKIDQKQITRFVSLRLHVKLTVDYYFVI